jgi:hypothetical protein
MRKLVDVSKFENILYFILISFACYKKACYGNKMKSGVSHLCILVFPDSAQHISTCRCIFTYKLSTPNFLKYKSKKRNDATKVTTFPFLKLISETSNYTFVLAIASTRCFLVCHENKICVVALATNLRNNNHSSNGACLQELSASEEASSMST